jgi:hypothetical protein
LVSSKIEEQVLLNKAFQILNLLFVAWMTLAACSSAKTQSPTLSQNNAPPSPTPKAQSSPSSNPNSPIRSIDFANISYPHYPVYVTDRGKKKYVTLKAGEGTPAYLNYGDVTGDGIEEAMLVLGIENRGSAIPMIVYIYGLKNGRPKPLWYFETGDRADGGLRQIYAENGELVVEFYGRGKIIGKDLYADDGTRGETPYPYICTRTRYQWRGKHFQPKGKAEEFSNPKGYGSPIMPLYSRSS